MTIDVTTHLAPVVWALAGLVLLTVAAILAAHR
jgi:hypothetical protein